MKKILMSLILLFAVSIMINSQELLIAKIESSAKGGVKKFTLSKSQQGIYKKIIIKYIQNEVKFGMIRLFFNNESEVNKKGGQGSLMINKENSVIEFDVENENILAKLTFYFSNSRNEEKNCIFEVYGVK
ncbi:MAG: hypothetical protein A2015_09805 [Spirochaetes bacterium GWF1_31_7]|nr:MAG: hypothetical protein A2Y30_07190 [Spirochaetes bacterium GWE1_32_154]OHD45647.1 MAG: hypothetical protein A2Y29_15710 [Spirochaetes bacterium GWE2_31_10]OHD48218.1 MAG: hypothetical protein A2015_09805 [Spirochaetes bacterium GWF1_31_7]HBD95792.1 hypothetical protein [Spirochaetia bacterium]HBI37597.1 hypothetical protein [Spirochaetia bacterium]